MVCRGPSGKHVWWRIVRKGLKIEKKPHVIFMPNKHTDRQCSVPNLYQGCNILGWWGKIIKLIFTTFVCIALRNTKTVPGTFLDVVLALKMSANINSIIHSLIHSFIQSVSPLVGWTVGHLVSPSVTQSVQFIISLLTKCMKHFNYM